MSAWIKRIFSPPVFEDEEKNHQAYLLNAILWGLIFVPVPYVLYVVGNTPQDAMRAVVQAVFGETVNFFLLLLLHRGYVRAASIIQVIMFWLFFTVSALTRMGARSEAYLLGYPLVITIAGILLGGRAATAISIFSLASGGVMVAAENTGLLIPKNTGGVTILWVVSMTIFPMIAILQHLSTQTVQRALRRARASEERYKLISDISTDYLFENSLDEQGNNHLVWLGGGFERMTGYTYQEYVASGGWIGHVHPDDIEQDSRDMDVLRNNQDVETEIRTYTKSGEIRWERIYAHPIWDKEKNRLIGIIGAVQDVTERKKAEDTLKEILLQQAAILNNIPDMAWLKDKDSRYIAINEQFAKVAGLDAGEIIGKKDFDVWHEKHAQGYREDDLLVMNRREQRRFEEMQEDHTGREYWVETVKTPIFNAAGDVVGTTGIARDISGRKKEEMEREALIAELEAKNAELERFTYTVSHDLKSPLVTITGFLGYIERDALSGDFGKLKKDIERVQAAADKMQRLLKDLLELSRIGRLMNPPVNIEYGEIVKDALELVQGQVKEKNVFVEFQDNHEIVRGDQTRLVEVLQNLIDNAIKFMGQQPNPHIQIGSLTNQNNEIVFFVKDNGTGIAPEYHEKIFGLFNKLNTESEGTGIGLTLVKRIIEVHGGRIWVDSQPGKGAAFYFTLPTT